MRKALLFAAFVAALAAAAPPAPASAQSLTDFFKNANLEPLAKTNDVLDLVAQSTSKTPQGDVNSFDDYFLINGVGKLVVNFNRSLQNKGQTAIPGWIGVAPYSNRTITADLQAGFQAVVEHFRLVNAKAAKVVVYKTLNTGQLVYDYSIPVRSTPNICQEYLFTPETHGFQPGMAVRCYWTLEGFKVPRHSAAGIQAK